MDNLTLCCFCGKPTIYQINGNDPQPIVIRENSDAICCDECNAKIVIPTRKDVWTHYHNEQHLKILNQKLYNLLFKQLEEKGCDNIASMIDQMTGDINDVLCDTYKANYIIEFLSTNSSKFSIKVNNFVKSINNAIDEQVINGNDAVKISTLKEILKSFDCKPGVEEWYGNELLSKIKGVNIHQ